MNHSQPWMILCSAKQSLNPNQFRQFLCPDDLGPNCLQRLSADGARGQSTFASRQTLEQLLNVSTLDLPHYTFESQEF